MARVAHVDEIADAWIGKGDPLVLAARLGCPLSRHGLDRAIRRCEIACKRPVGGWPKVRHADVVSYVERVARDGADPVAATSNGHTATALRHPEP
jgi:hypothetical protein